MNLDDFLKALQAKGRFKRCPECGDSDRLRIVRRDDQHYGRVVCDNHLPDPIWLDGYTGKPGNLDRKTRRDGSAKLMAIIEEHWPGGPLYCLTCLRTKEELAAAGEWLEAHHIVERQNGGLDHHTNLQPQCSSDHALIHWRRRTVSKQS